MIDWDSPEIREEYARQFPYAEVALGIVELRGRLQITQTQLAQLIGSVQPVVSNAESGKHEVSSKLLKRIAEATGTRLDIHFVPKE